MDENMMNITSIIKMDENMFKWKNIEQIDE